MMRSRTASRPSARSVSLKSDLSRFVSRVRLHHDDAPALAPPAADRVAQRLVAGAFRASSSAQTTISRSSGTLSSGALAIEPRLHQVVMPVAYQHDSAVSGPSASSNARSSPGRRTAAPPSVPKTASACRRDPNASRRCRRLCSATSCMPVTVPAASVARTSSAGQRHQFQPVQRCTVAASANPSASGHASASMPRCWRR